MFALKSSQGARQVADRSAASRAAAAWDGIVLPRWLRKPARVLGRLVSGDMTAPRYAATIMTAVFMSATGVYGAIIGGHAPAVIQAVTARSGFAIEDVRMAGNKETSEIDVLQELGLDGWTSLVGFDADAARERIANMPWVSDASVRKIYPNVLEVELAEKKPLAIWQHGQQLSLIDDAGHIIVPFNHPRYATLPVFIGAGANERAAEFMSRIARTPELSVRVKAFIRVADRRWDLRLENGVTIRLPEYGEDAAIAEVARLDREQGILSRDVAAVDMRLEDRVVVRLTPEAATRREAALSEQAKKSKSGKKI
ncbi:cell division protein FtsQ/DivIB [Mesorhizobium sp. J428]|uniref:cell division protein FtsQ/DivIB n=1 Tax=Mesorhizobium sp. J428 TaxID=2898440 RepID=UPI002151C0FA|nr:cell division protein FtsQ/DivIB [Mesorhizobium sp. J428]MCR5855333.1 cell division protein FtsQ/DivIB [Mesorhizobium sp. J428]